MERYEWVTVTLPDGQQVTVTRYTDGVNDVVEYTAQTGHHEGPGAGLRVDVVFSD